MDLELVITTILTWMKVNVESAAPWVQWAGGAYAIYWFIRGNQVVLWDAARAVWWLTQTTHLDSLTCWVANLTGVPSALRSLNTWRKQPSKYAALLTRCKTLEDRVSKLPNMTLSYSVDRPKGNKPDTADEIPVLPAPVEDETDQEQDVTQRTKGPAADNRRQADLQAQVDHARKNLDGGLNRRPATTGRHITFVDSTTPPG